MQRKIILRLTKKSIESVRKYSKLPIFLYLLNSDLKLDIENVFTIKWDCNIEFDSDMFETQQDENFYINRKIKTYIAY